MDIRKFSNINIKQNGFSIKPNTLNDKNLLEEPIDKNTVSKDMVYLSDEAKSLLAQSEDLTKNDELSNELKKMIEDLKNASDPKNNPLDSFIKCVKIATRIMKGDHVPEKDIKFLAETEPKMYSSAILLRQQNDKPKKHDSLLEDEKEDSLKINDELQEYMSAKE